MAKKNQTGDQIVESYEDLIAKYKTMLDVRKENYAIDINKFLPNISDMLKEDCVWDVLKDIEKEINGTRKNNVEKTAYYVEDPPMVKPGYYPDQNCFVLKHDIDKIKFSDKAWQFGEIDGTHWYFDIVGIDVGGSFTVDKKEYNSFEEYLQANNVNYTISEDENGNNTSKLTIVSAGAKAASIPRFATQKVKDINKIKKATVSTAKLNGYSYMPHKINRNNSDDPTKWTITNYKDDEELQFYVASDGSYHQIVTDINAKEIIKSQGKTVSDDDNYYTIVADTSSKWGSETVIDGYRAQRRVRELLSNSKIKSVISVVDRNVMIGQKVSSGMPYYNSVLFPFRNISTLIKDWNTPPSENLKLSNLSFGGFGCDKSGSMIGNVWVLLNTEYGDQWINLSKYVVAGTNYTDTNPSFSDSSELGNIYDGLSDAFKSWNNNSTNFKYADSISANGTTSYEERIALHKELTGIDFATAREYTVLLGDTLFLIPPEAIHTSSTLDYEKLPVLRGKGSIMKNRTNIEEVLELELYFNNEYGINGIPYETTTPSGQSITYYMNGLRSLIAQFRVSPFLPIENHYINDVLNIEVVSLVNINVSTVDGFPKLLKVVLTLRDFNYRVFMPDLPFPEFNEDGVISTLQPVFAKCFDWELFRYYYQRGLINGEQLNSYEYNSYEYGDFIYSNKNIYSHANLGDSNFEFFVPDVAWLKAALQVKKSRDQHGKIDFDLEGEKTEGYIVYEGDNKDIVTIKNNNAPMFTDEQKNRIIPYQSFSNLDKHKRCGKVEACLTGSLMPGDDEERGDISGVTPTGYINNKYNFISDGGYLYNRCHLIGWQLTGENDNKKNLITGTRALNDAMLIYENKVAKYLKANPDNHVYYRVTPIFDGGNLLASGVQMEAYSVEDDGKAIQFNVYIANVQDKVYINYGTGDNRTTGNNNSETNTELFNYYHYKDPRNMKFVPFITDENGNSIPIELDAISFNMSNYFTETHLKALDGFAPQYMGGSDVTIDMQMTLSDEFLTGSLKNVPHYIMDMIRTYRRVMPCFPLKIKNEYLQMIGVNEVVFDNITVSTKPGFPGVYDVHIKLTSMDRTMRQREALEKVNTNVQTSAIAAENIGNYFSLKNTLSAAEVYPDLDLPTIQELKDLGWRFAKWSNEKRVFVDPDFYMCYSFQYASKLIKEIINNILYKISYNAGVQQQKEQDDGTKPKNSTVNSANILNQMTLIDSTAMGADITAGTDLNGINVDNEVGFSSLYNDIVKGVQNGADNNGIRKNTNTKEGRKDRLYSTTSVLQYLTATGIENGWAIKPGWNAPLCDKYINDEMTKFKYSGVEVKKDKGESDNQIIAEIYDLRHRIIMQIDKLLDRPIQSTSELITYSDYVKCSMAVDNFFNCDAGKQLIKLLCPLQDDELIHNLDDKESLFEKAEPYMWLKGFLYALACTRSGSQVYAPNKKDDAWQPNQFQNKKYDKSDEGAKEHGYKGDKIPYNKIELKNNVTDNPFADTFDAWYNNGKSFGCGQITKYPKSQIKSMLEPKSKIKYFNYSYKGGASEYYNNMYYKTKKAKRDRFCETGFIDPYYNYLGYNSKAGKEFIELISTKQISNYEALLREVLMFLKYMIMEGYLISEIDVIAQDWGLTEDLLKDSAMAPYDDIKPGDPDYPMYYTDPAMIEAQNTAWAWNAILNKDEPEPEPELDKEEQKRRAEIADGFRKEIPKTYGKLFCARLIYPFMLAATYNSKKILKLIEERNYAILDTYTLGSNVGCENNTALNKFFNAMYGLKMIGSSKVEDSAETTSNSQKAFNTLMSEAFTYMSNDPRCYVLHSFYDMCVGDKRGRLLRAFPCYYILFVDEGRQIGTWKLFDNFYNMSSISDLQVVKSRKIAADTCTFTMSNMFMSYADTYDNTIYNQYVQAYGIKDVVSSIFTPRDYVSKEDMIRQRKELTDTTPINAGVRLHVRMGYGSDASKLPIVFNGKVAEVNCGETVDIVAQGDGHELMNPLNALGEITARNLDETQSWFTLFKDIRGGLARGGQTPRNLLAKLSTAQYGGAFKTVIRHYTDGRFFYDNPFGLYHFGDRRFKDIFIDSEIVQNMYEVSNRTILNGTNDLITDVNAETCAPILNCNIQDKTMWEIGHLCANAGDDYFFAVRDFGMRSTMCLCMGNHYYAYEYDEDSSGLIAEKRKPFQQYHYYDSYNDIIYNALKASETNMKTNAVGTWEGSDMIWGTGQQSVGPIYLDMNIHPEYQKSMTVETGLVSGGDGGINIPLFTALSEKYNYDEYAGKVNKSVAEKVTTNVLRQSVKDMYEGEICVIGDATLKPYDRVSMIDVFEDMTGSVEVETVIHSMNIETGFTTTFIPDVIVRGENNAQEVGGQSVLSSFLTSCAIAIVGKSSMALMTKKGSVGLAKIAAGEVGKKLVQKTAQSAFSGFVKSAVTTATADVGIATLFTNPYVLGSMVIAASSLFMTMCNYKEMFFRFCRNVQALTVYPVSKNNRMLVAGMSGHQGSVYGSKSQSAIAGGNNSIQSYIMKFLEGEKGLSDSWTINMIGKFSSFILTDENYEICKNKWINNLGLSESNDVIQNGTSINRNREVFIQNITGTISKEYSSRQASLAALKTKPRIKKFNTNDRTDPVYMSYQIGGVWDKELWKQKEYENDPNVKYVEADELGKHERIKMLHPVEDDPDIKMAIYSDTHPVIKQFKFAHSASNATFDLLMEGGNTEIRYLTITSGKKTIFDLPMLQEDALMLIKIIINDETLTNKTITFMSGTQVNSTASWKSTGFAFSLSCDDIGALESVSKALKADSNWTAKESQTKLFDYKVTDDTIQYTVYALQTKNNTYSTSTKKEDDK